MSVNKPAVILDFASLAPDDLDLTQLWALPLDFELHDHTHAGDIGARLEGKAVAFTNKVPIDRALMQANPQLELIVILATGTNNIDLDAAAEFGIKVANAVDYSTESVVQHTFSMMLALTTNLLNYSEAVQQGRWCGSPFFGLLEFPITELSGKTLGIIGYGSIGKRVKVIAEAFGMQVQIAQSVVPDAPQRDDRVSLDILLATSDVVSVHSPLSEHTRNLIDEAALAKMKSDAILLNTGRGGVVDEQALLKALEEGTLGAAGLDVLSKEPPAEDQPLLQKRLPNLIITPHSAWGSRQSRQALVNQVVAIVQSAPTGKLVNSLV